MKNSYAQRNFSLKFRSKDDRLEQEPNEPKGLPDTRGAFEKHFFNFFGSLGRRIL